ncbi:30S ribosome-binding factor RbfA [Candidatus Actinomarina]|nr:30S ribosome-binding factor RbfA [Candidatus Actinomarina sp.]
MKKQTRGGRINRINPLIHKIIASELLRNSNPTLNKATVTHVSTSPDLKRCTIYVSSLENVRGTLSKSLEKSRMKIQKELGKQLTTKFIPRIQFEIDTSFENTDKVNELIYKIHEK